MRQCGVVITMTNPFLAFTTQQVILVTGGTGFVGSHLINQLLEAGHKVFLLTRQVDKVNAKWLAAGVVAIDTLTDIPASQRIDAVINLAGARILGLPWTDARRAILRDSRVGLTEHLVSWMRNLEQKPKLFISASAIGYYGIQHLSDDSSLTEACPAQNIFMSNLCRQWEEAAQRANELGVPAIITRFGVVLGKGGALPSLLLPIKLGLGGPLGSGKQWMSWIHIQDLLAGLANVWLEQLAAPSVCNVYNFTAPEALRQKEFSCVAARVLGRPCWFPTPSWPMKLVLGEQSQLLLEGQRVFPSALLAQGFTFEFPTLESALENLCR